MNGKGTTNIVIVALAVIIAGGLGYFALMQKQIPVSIVETSTWSTYQNAVYGFELKYPPEITLSENPGETWVNIVFEKLDFRFTFFAGMRPVGGYIGFGPVWEKKILIDGKMVDETLVRCEDNKVMLRIAYTKFNGQDRYDNFSSDCFSESLADIFVPQMEAIAKTLKYLE